MSKLMKINFGIYISHNKIKVLQVFQVSDMELEKWQIDFLEDIVNSKLLSTTLD